MRQLSSGGHFVDGELLALRHDLSNSLELTLPDESRPPLPDSDYSVFRFGFKTR